MQAANEASDLRHRHNRVLMILPNRDFDVTETSVPWRILVNNGVTVHFATSDGQPGQCDQILLGSVVFGMLGACEEAKRYYKEMEQSKEFQSPAKYSEVNFMDYDAVILPGGHAKGMVQYLEDTTIRTKLVPFINDPGKVVGAICHGTIVVARTIDPSTGKSLLWNRRSTCLPTYMERNAYFLSFWKHGKYYRTYDAYVEEEVRANMKDPGQQFDGGICNWGGSLDKKYASVCVDGNYVSGRWPGDAWLFANTILEKLK